MKYEIEWINIGRSNFNNKIIKEFETLNAVRRFAYIVADEHLMSRNTSMDATEKKGVFDIYAGFRLVGKVKIREIK